MCQSIYHWANDYPNKVKEDSSNNVKITVFIQDVHCCYIEKFVVKKLEIGWTKNVDGYLNSLTPRDLLNIIKEKSSSSFKFGDGNTVLSTTAVTIPATISKDDVLVNTYVIQNKMTYCFCSAKILLKRVMLR